MAKASLISHFTMPERLDVTNSSQMGEFSIELSSDVHWIDPHVQLTFRYIPFSFELGKDNSFDDNTPLTASTSVEFHGGYPAGSYFIDKLYIWDDAAGISESYTEQQLSNAGLPYWFGIQDRWAPDSPTLKVSATGGLITGNRAQVTGTAEAGSTVTVYYRDGGGNYGRMPSAVADAQGNWSITSDVLVDGDYTDVVAVAANRDGYLSQYSTDTRFFVQQAPAAPVLHVANLENGAVDTDRPLIWGNASPRAQIALYDGASQIGIWTAGDDGWWALQLPPMDAGPHQLTARVTDRFGRVSPDAAPLLLNVGKATDGLQFKIDTVTNLTTQGLDQGKLQSVLDALSSVFSGVLDGAQTVMLQVTVREQEGHELAAAAATLTPAAGDMPHISEARLHLTTDFVEHLSDYIGLSSYTVGVLAHELLHVLGFNDAVDLFADHLETVGANTYFTGHNATAINGGKVLLSADASHVADETDLINPYYTGDHLYFSDTNSHSPFSGVDLAILKDLGYLVADTIVSADGHTYVPGNLKTGHNTITGIDGVDTLVLDAKAASYTIKAGATGYSVTDQAGTLQLSAIERIQFSDTALALDVAAHENGGMVYRMYQAAFGRTPDSAGLGYWLPKVDDGLAVLELAREFKNSTEFTQLYGANLGDSGFISQLYLNVLRRAPDQAGLDYWQNALHAGATRESVLLDFSESGENIARLAGVLHDGFSYTPMIA